MNLRIRNITLDNRASEELLSQIEDYFGYDHESEIYEYCLSETKEESFCMNVAQKYLDHEEFEIIEQNKSYENGLFIAYLIKKKSDDLDDIHKPGTTCFWIEREVNDPVLYTEDVI